LRQHVLSPGHRAVALLFSPATARRPAGEPIANILEEDMPLATRTAVLCLALGLAACDPGAAQRLLNPRQASNGQLLPRIDQQRHARDNCLVTYIAKNDNFQDRIEDTARNASAACSAEDDKLIDLLVEMDRDGRPLIAPAIRKESAFQAYRIALKIRAVPEKQPQPAEPRPTPTVEWR
jgi:hypothetical protein